MKIQKLLLILLIAAGFVCFGSISKASAHSYIFISMLSKIPGKKIAADYSTEFVHISAITVHTYNGTKRYIKYVRFSGYDKALNIINDSAPSGANACINLRLSYDNVACEYVKLAPKK
ncbi:MAG: hypothetical protein ACYCT7_11195 [bacterium]